MSVISIQPLSRAAVECFRQLFLDGPVWDGDIVSKEGRGELFKLGYANRVDGWSFLSTAGVKLAITSGLDREKEKRRR